MGKILSGIMGIVLVASVVGGTAFAVFTSQATVSGISINAGNASLQVYNGASYTSGWDTSLNLENVYPGYTDNTLIKLKNSSSSNIKLAITGLLTSAGGWPDLADVVQVAVEKPDGSASTGWQTLSVWNAAPIAFPGDPLSQNEEREFKVFVQVPSSAGDEIAGKALTNVTFTLTGTQTP